MEYKSGDMASVIHPLPYDDSARLVKVSIEISFRVAALARYNCAYEDASFPPTYSLRSDHFRTRIYHYVGQADEL